MAAESRLKRVLTGGGVAYGACLDTLSPAIAEIAGYAGLDYVRIDTEYSWRRDESLEHVIRACKISGCSPLVRVEKGQPYLVSKALQAGADAILVTDISSYDEAVGVVRSARFAPNGIRGYNTFTPAGRWGLEGGKAWVEACDANIMVGVMIESQDVLDDVERIAALDGLDFLFFGPSDFSMSIGYREPRKNDHVVQAAMRRTCEAAAAHGKWTSLPLGAPFESEVSHYGEMGFRMLELGHDVAVLSSFWRDLLGKLKTEG